MLIEHVKCVGYAAPIVKRIDPTGTIFNAVLFRGATVNLAGQENVKDLAAVGSSIERTVLLDNNPFSFVAQPCNGIPVVPFAGDPHDRNLMSKLLPVLKELAEEPDVRPVLRSRYNVEEWLIQRGYQVAPQP